MRDAGDKQSRLRASAARSRWELVLQKLSWSHRDVIAVAVAGAAGGAIVINALFMQPGPHPAPIFQSGPAMPPAPARKGTTAAGHGHAPVVSKVEPAQAPSRAGAEIVADIQRELARRGFFDGVVDGRRGPRTEAAVLEFEQAAGMKPIAEPTEALLAEIRRSDPKIVRRIATAATTGSTVPRPPQSVRNDPIVQALAPSKRVLAIQRALAAYGYGQIKPTGIVDAETRAAIEGFERERKLPVTGAASDRVARELAAAIGRPLE